MGVGSPVSLSLPLHLCVSICRCDGRGEPLCLHLRVCLQVCDGRGEPCDGLCGGAGCGKCGGLSCDDGSVTKANRALDFAEQAEELLNKKAVDADRVLTSVSPHSSSSHLEQYSPSHPGRRDSPLIHH